MLSLCWLLASLGGPEVMPMSKSFYGYIINIYIHGLITLCMIIEVLIHKREHLEQHFYQNLVILMVFSTIYYITITLFAEFADIANISFFNTEYIDKNRYFYRFNSYQLYHYIFQKRWSYDHNSISDCN